MSHASDSSSSEDEAAVDSEIVRDEPDDADDDEEEGEDLYNDNYMEDYRRMNEHDQYESVGLDDSIEDERDLDQIMEDRRAQRWSSMLEMGAGECQRVGSSPAFYMIKAKRLKAIMMAAAELAALRLRDLPSTNNKRCVETDRRDRVFRLLDKNGDGRISIEEVKEVIEELGAEGEDAQELMLLLDANSDGSLNSEEFDSFQKQVEFMRHLEDTDDHYRTLMDEKLQTSDSSGLIQLYRKELGNRLEVR